MTRAHALPKTTSARKRVGRGTGSDRGKTAGRGTKGQKSRTGHHMMPAWFEGGQQPLTERIPKLRGFKNHGQRTAAVPVGRLAKFPSGAVNLDTLRKAGLVPRDSRKLKLFGTGTVPKFSVTADAVTKSAEQAIKKAGGSVSVITAPEPKAEKESNPANAR